MSNRDPEDADARWADTAWTEEPAPPASSGGGGGLLPEEPFPGDGWGKPVVAHGDQLATDDEPEWGLPFADPVDAGEALPPDERDKAGPPARSVAWRMVLPTALAALVLVALGVGILAANGRPTHPIGVRTVGTATRAPSATATYTPNLTPTIDQFVLPNEVLRFGVGGTTANNQQCTDTSPLDPLTFTLYNSGTVPVDWFVSITDPTPDGKLPWAVAGGPYGTLPAGESADLTITPDPSLCGLLARARAPVTYHATIFYGGVGGLTITDTVTPSRVISTPVLVGP